MEEYTEVIKRLDAILKNYPKVYREYTEAGRIYRQVYAKHLMEVHSQYASQPLRESAVEAIMNETENEIVDRWQTAEYEFSLITNEQRVLSMIAKLLTSRDFNERYSAA